MNYFQCIQCTRFVGIYSVCAIKNYQTQIISLSKVPSNNETLYIKHPKKTSSRHTVTLFIYKSDLITIPFHSWTSISVIKSHFVRITQKTLLLVHSTLLFSFQTYFIKSSQNRNERKSFVYFKFNLIHFIYKIRHAIEMAQPDVAHRKFILNCAETKINYWENISRVIFLLYFLCLKYIYNFIIHSHNILYMK